MRALLLAAGKGTRLRPLTEDRPKPMIDVAGRPILEHNVRLLARHGVCDLVINLHHRPEVIVGHFGDGARFGVSIAYSYEPELLGTAGALNPIRSRLEETFLVVYADNLTTCNLTQLLRLHRQARATATLSLFERERVNESGIVGLEGERITRFLEKPARGQEFSRWVNAGIVALEPAALTFIPPVGFYDIGRDLLPALLASGARLSGYRMSEPLWWIDSTGDYERVIADPTVAALLGADS